jgi:hypothetical protein
MKSNHLCLSQGAPPPLEAEMPPSVMKEGQACVSCASASRPRKRRPARCVASSLLLPPIAEGRSRRKPPADVAMPAEPSPCERTEPVVRARAA